MEALESAIYHIVPHAQEEIKHLDEVGIEPRAPGIKNGGCILFNLKLKSVGKIQIHVAAVAQWLRLELRCERSQV